MTHRLPDSAGVDHALATTPLTSSQDASDVLSLVETEEDRRHAPMLDEQHRTRLEAVATGRTAPDVAGHHGVLVRDEDRCVAYGGLTLPPGDRHGVGDVVVAGDGETAAARLTSTLSALDEIARDHDAHGTEVWSRAASTSDVVTAVAAGYALCRRLAVLGRDLESTPLLAPTEPAVPLRAATDADADAIVRVLDAAYAGTAEAGWDSARLDQARARPWFRFEDIVLAELDGEVVGVHWTKRRDPWTGEVHNLAVSPHARGRGLGLALLDAGLAHLVATGCSRAWLWVDLANEAAVRLYVSRGFRPLWEDVAFSRHVRSTGPHDHAHHDIHG